MTHTTAQGLLRPVKVLSDLKDVSELLGGARVDEVRMDRVDGQLQAVIELTRAMRERQATVRQGFVKRVKMPWTKCRLTLRDVRGASVQRVEDRPEQEPLLSGEAVTGGYQITVRAPDGLQVVLTMGQLDGALGDVGSPIESP